MNKAEFVADVAERLGEPKQRGEEIVNAVFEALTAALKRGDEVRLPSFGVMASCKISIAFAPSIRTMDRRIR
jgi:DNA-binding protein HU-beta